MKITVILAVITLAFASCSKETVVRNEEPATPTPIPATPTPVPAMPAPEVAVTAPPAATPAPAPQLAPEGVFYLIAAARIESPDGVHGLPPGTGVKLVRPGVYLTPYGETPLAQEQLTNDLAVARSARDAYAATQAAAQQRGAAEAKVAADRTRVNAADTNSNHEAALKGIERERIEKRIAELNRQKVVVDGQISALRAKQNKESYNKVIKGRTVTSTTEQQLTAAVAQFQALDEQVGTAYMQLNNLK